MILYLEFIVRMYGFALIYIIIRCFVLYGIASLIVCVDGKNVCTKLLAWFILQFEQPPYGRAA